MYKVIGVDHREYGPVPVERIREWILAGRLNAQSRIQPASGEWKTVGQLAEFSEALHAQAAAAPPPPRIALGEADRMAAAMTARGYAVDIGDWFSRAWRLVVQEFWLLGGATAVVLMLALGIVSFPVIGTVAILLLGFVLWGSLGWVFLKRIRGLRADMGDAFAGFSTAFVPLMLAGLVIQVLTAVGLALCIVPGIYLFVIWWGFVPLLILDKRLEFWPAMELSRRVVNERWWEVAALMLCVTAVGLSGLLLFGVGVFLTFPLGVAACVYAYEEIFGKIDPATLALAASPPEGTSNSSKSTATVATASPAAPAGTTPGPEKPAAANPASPLHAESPPAADRPAQT